VTWDGSTCLEAWAGGCVDGVCKSCGFCAVHAYEANRQGEGSCQDCEEKAPDTPSVHDPIVVRDDLRIVKVPPEDVFRRRSIAIAYQSPFGGAGIYLTPEDARACGRALLAFASAELRKKT